MRILLFKLFILCAGVLAIPSAAATDNIRIATFNINWGNVNLPDVERAIKMADADLVCIQESNTDSERFLTRRLRNQYPHATFVGHRGQYFAERFGFLSRTKLKHVHYDPPANGLFGTYYATTVHNQQDVQVINVHLSPFTVQRGSSIGQAMQAIIAVEEVHQKEIANIKARLDVNRPTLICGDFNSMSTFSAPRQLIDLGMTDSFAAVTENADSQPTWRWPIGNSHIQFRIDYVFHSRHFETISCRIVPTTGSDHCLLVSEMKLNAIN